MQILMSFTKFSRSLINFYASNMTNTSNEHNGHCFCKYLQHTSWLIGKDCDVGRDWGQEEEGTTEDEMAGWQHRLDGHEFEWPAGIGDGQRGLACCNSWGRKELDTAGRLNWTDKDEDMTLLNTVNSKKKKKKKPKNKFKNWPQSHSSEIKI